MGVILVCEQNRFVGTFRIARFGSVTSGAHNGEPGFGERMGAKGSLAVVLTLVSLPKERVCRP